MKRRTDAEDLLDTVGCQPERRPDGPGIDEILPLATTARRTPGQLSVDFQPHAGPSLTAFVAAERECCPDIGWEVAAGPPLRLVIRTNERALDIFDNMLRLHDIDSIQ